MAAILSRPQCVDIGNCISYLFKKISSLRLCHAYSPLCIIECFILFTASTELSGWMRYDGYHLSGHTAKVLPYVASDTGCWEYCLQETSFLCQTLAYATRGNRTCLLYNTKALFHYANWTRSAEMTYYEYCENGNTKGSWAPSQHKNRLSQVWGFPC